MTLTTVIRRMDTVDRKVGGSGWADRNRDVITAHGSRKTFSD